MTCSFDCQSTPMRPRMFTGIKIGSRIFAAILFYAAVLASLGLSGCGGQAQDQGEPVVSPGFNAAPSAPVIPSDTTPPTVSDTSPDNAATGVATNASVSASFSEAMTNATLTTTSFTLVRTAGGAAVAGTVSMSGNTARFTPSVALLASTQYTATVTNSVTDAAGEVPAGRVHPALSTLA